MIVFKFSWLPYILILAGIILAADGQPAALILTAAGAVWLYFKYQNQQSAASSDSASDPTAEAPYSAPTAPPPPVSTPKPEAPVAAPKPEAPTPQEANACNFCRYCGAKVIPGSAFCISCGKKL